MSKKRKISSTFRIGLGLLALGGGTWVVAAARKAWKAGQLVRERTAHLSGRDKQRSAISVAIVGCGAVARKYHLPVATTLDGVTVSALIDKNLTRAQELAAQFNIPYASDDYGNIVGKADMAILALPHSLHAPVSIDLLHQGIHVLVEKPMAMTSAECNQMIQAAEESSSVLGVGLVRRFYAPSLAVKQVLEAGLLGDILSFDFREGAVYNWPVASDFFFRKETAGGGVLMDTGAYTLALLLWWLGDYQSVKYFDDAMGGIEADCSLEIELKNGARGTVELSRTRQLRNSYIIRGERGTLEVGIGPNADVSLRPAVGETRVEGKALLDTKTPQVLFDAFRYQLSDFIDAVQNQHSPRVSGYEGRRSVEFIEACYANRSPLSLPWLRASV